MLVGSYGDGLPTTGTARGYVQDLNRVSLAALVNLRGLVSTRMQKRLASMP